MTVDPRNLVKRCPGSTRKGDENLARMRKGLFPRREGPPKAVCRARELRIREAAVGLPVFAPDVA